MSNLLKKDAFDNIQRVARAFSTSSMVPAAYQNNLANCIVAMEYADRLNKSPLEVMQNLYMVNGNPSWKSSYVIGLINHKYGKNLKFEYSGEGDDFGCVAVIDEMKSQRVTIRMAKAEGWYDRKGSKWKTMPEQMLAYRCASFFKNMYCPEITMGFPTTEEIEDITVDEESIIIE